MNLTGFKVGLYIVVGILLFVVFSAVSDAVSGLAAGALDGSSDGRTHTCGYVTEDGVTEHLSEYHARCGDTP